MHLYWEVGEHAARCRSVLTLLLEACYKPDILVGNSIGSVNAGLELGSVNMEGIAALKGVKILSIVRNRGWRLPKKIVDGASLNIFSSYFNLPANRRSGVRAICVHVE